jgi:UDPglucose 6-dehydrogenase
LRKSGGECRPSAHRHGFSDSRIGKRFLFPGIGYGGSCFPKDVQALAKTASEYSYDFKILKSVMKVNGIQKGVLTKK